MKGMMYKLFYHISIRRFLAIFILMFIIIPSTIATYATYQYTVKTIKENYATSYMNAVFNEIDYNISNIAMQINSNVMTILNQAPLPAMLPGSEMNALEREREINYLLDSNVTKDNIIKAIEFITRDGIVYHRGIDLPESYSKDHTFLSSLSSQTLCFNKDSISADGQYYYAIGKKLYNYSTSTELGSLIFYLDESSLNSFHSTFDARDQGLFFITIDDQIVSHPDKQFIGLSPYFPGEAIGNMPDGVLNEKNYTLAKYSIKNSSIYNKIEITSIIANDLLFSTMHKIITAVIFVFLIISLVAVFMSILFSKKLITGIIMLKKSMQNLPDSNTGSVKTSPSNELAVLEESFNKMSYEITMLISQIKQEQEKLRIAEINALQSQINPHFIYNALDTISWKAKKNKQPEIDKMLITLASFFRIGLHKGDTVIKISDEIKHVKSYLYIESLRFKDLFETKFDIDDRVLDKYVVKIILQPIVENSIKHGFANIDYKGLITIQAFPEGNDIVFIITDNGKGVKIPDGAKFPKSIDTNGGYGIYNVNKRLTMYYGSNCTLTFSSSPGNGTKVTLRLKGQMNT